MKNILVLSAAIAISTYILPGVSIVGGLTPDGLVNLLLVSIILTAVNIFIKPFIVFITLPINIITLGLFTLFINALLIIIIDFLLPGFIVSGFWAAFLFGIVLCMVKVVLHSLEK